MKEDRNANLPPHASGTDDVLRRLGASPDGLSPEEAARRLEEYGRNELPKEKGPSLLLLFLKQFRSFVVYLLVAAAGVSLFTGHLFDAAAIAFVLLVNAAVGFVQERKAERAIAALQDMLVPHATVVRGGHMARVEAALLVPGDIVRIDEGDRVPADLRLLSARELHAAEAALTGESEPVAKDPSADIPADAAPGDRKNMLFMGTTAVRGQGVGVVVATGLETVFGGITSSLIAIKRERTPFEKQVDVLGRWLGLLALAFSALILAVGLLRDLPALDMFLFAVAAAVSAIPEGLPVVLVVVLAIGVQRMARRNAITRHLPAVETLGVVDVICSDKTGTITESKMTVRRLAGLAGDIRVTGEGWEPEGEFFREGKPVVAVEDPFAHRILRAAAVCNRAEIELKDGRRSAVGDPTEAALVVAAEKAGLEKSVLMQTERILDEIPFSSEHKYRAVLHEGGGRRTIMAVGAFEALLAASDKVMAPEGDLPLDGESAAELERLNGEMAASALRILGVAVKDAPEGMRELRREDVRGLTFLGFVGMIDPPRKGIADVIRRCRTAGIRVIMNTGDHRATAVAIAREVGILGEDEPEDGRVFTDGEVAAMSDEELRARLEKAAVFARVSPATKLRVVTELKRLGHVVAMTGDGVNDAPALKQADIGVAMGITGTDVTKEVAEMVLSDDNFVSIVNAVEEGRIVFRNVKQTTGFLVMTNGGEILTVLATLAVGLPLPLLPAQILWLNVVTDVFNTVALATERKHGDELKEPPRRRHARIITRNTLLLLLIVAALMAAGTLLLFSWALSVNGIDYARTVAFLVMALFQLWNVFNMRSFRLSIFTLGWWTNRWTIGAIALSVLLIVLIMYVPVFQPVFRFVPVGWKEWAFAAAVAATVLPVVELYKVLLRRGVVPKRWI